MSTSKIRKQAARWVVRVHTAKDLESIWPEFEAWLGESPEHRRLYEVEERYWVEVDPLRAWTLQDTSRTPESVLAAVARTRRHGHVRLVARVAGATACCVAVAFALEVGLRRHPAEAHTWVPYARGADQLTPVSLEDGSVVQLNAHSQVRTRLTSAEREVELDTGEAYFDVRTEPGRPFDVEAGSVVVRAVGTAFSVKKDDNGQVEATVKRGKVEVKSTSPSQGSKPEAKPESRLVTAGQVVTIAPSGKMTVDQADAAQIAQRLRWADPVISLNGTLAEAVAQFNLYNVRKLVILEVELAHVRISGRYRVTQPDAFAESLKLLGIKSVAVGPESSAQGQILLSKNENPRPPTGR